METIDKKKEDSDALWVELQGLWAEQAAGIDALCAQPVAQPRRLRPRRALSTRRLRMAECAALALVNVAVVVFAVFGLPRREGFDEWIDMAGALLGLTAAAAAVVAAVSLVRLVRGNPARRILTLTTPVVRVDFLRRVATVSSAAAVLMVFVNKAPLGDGYGIDAHGMDRAYAVLSVDKVVELMA